MGSQWPCSEKIRMKMYLRSVLFARLIPVVIVTVFLLQCKQKEKLPPADPSNGGLFLPGKFDALVVADSIGRARHLAVNDNGDIYVKLTYNDARKGAGGTVGLRDTDGDG